MDLGVLQVLALLLACQLAGEVVTRAANLPVPGPVLGMLFLLLGLITWFTVHRHITRLEDARIGPIRGKLLGSLSLILWFGVALAGRAIAFV